MAAGVMLVDHLAQMEHVRDCGAAVREVTRQVGLHQRTGSCDCGRFVMGCLTARVRAACVVTVCPPR